MVFVLSVYFDNLCSEKLHSLIAGQSAPKLAINELNTALKTVTLQTLGLHQLIVEKGVEIH